MTSFVIDLFPDLVARLQQSNLSIGVPTVPASVEFEQVEAPDGSFVTSNPEEDEIEEVEES